ncbi:MAG: lipoprotein signal peptidase [Gammaproteobacteria bacterium]|nr:lipoprotein signal peptidase [Gammaproteobacteria bacterium]
MKWLWLSLLVLVIDQATKLLASHYLQLHVSVAVFPGINLTLMQNPGAAFSLLSQAGGWQRWFFIGLAVTVGIAIIVWLVSLPADKRWMAFALALILGGAMGNLWDRMTLSYVIDFIDVYYQEWHWPAFNIADSAISIGAVMLVIDTFWFGEAKVSI